MDAYENLRNEMDSEQPEIDWKAEYTKGNAEKTALIDAVKKYEDKVRDLEEIVRLLLYRKFIDAYDWKNITIIDKNIHLCIHSYDTKNRISRDILFLWDNQIQDLYEYHEHRDHGLNLPRSCPFAATIAFNYFSTSHVVMRPERIKGILRCCNPHDKLVMTNGKPQKNDAMITPRMRAYALSPITLLSGAISNTRSCIWKYVKDMSFNDLTNEKGASHEIIYLTMANGERILVDFSIGQFRIIPDSCMLLIPL